MYTHRILVAGCKINLYLRITGRRPDGYHDLDTLFYPLGTPSDRIAITPRSGPSNLTISCSDPLLQGPNNILNRVYFLYQAKTGRALPNLHIRLTKGIPTGAGLGGGSSDAAALLRYLDGPDPVGTNLLQSMARTLGADVPFFLQDRPAWAQGIGDRLSPVEFRIPAKHLLLIFPPLSVSTAWAYHAWDALDVEKPWKSPELTSTFPEAKQSPFRNGVYLYNDFERVVFPRHKALRHLKIKLLTCGALGCLMTGSGSCLFGLFEDQRGLDRARKYLNRHSFPHHSHGI
ncbi:MAG: 4-(cytidine 5'-diphospho)-2-C-methyl-D-erythritol kinase [Deltaproteobacteria bacterium]|nr:4-(cytidine 5'-diphospho)-2-C-methyl-D-erythritol kinase [Deltaproteobacteria bacterium]